MQLTEEQQKELQKKLKNMSPEELQEFQKQQCIFCQIVAGKIPSKKVYEDKICLAVMDINPATKGHVLLMPKEHYAIMPQIPEEELTHMHLVAKQFSQIFLKSLKVSGTTIFIANGMAAGQRAQHFMMHLIPRKDNDDLLKAEEKLIARDLQQKVKIAVERRFNEIMGIKKEVEVAKEEKAEEFKEIVEEEIKLPKAKRSKVEEEKVEEEIIEAKEKPVEEPTEEKTKIKKKSGKKKKDEPEDKEESDVSLDDIANLFK